MSRPRLLTASAGLLALALSAGSASAQTTYTWSGTGGDGNWSTAANWGGTAPASSLTDTRINLAGATNTATTIDASYGSALQVLGLTFAPNSGPFVVNGGGPVLEVGAEGIAYGNASLGGGPSDQTVAAPVRLGADQTWVNYGAGHLKLTGSVDTNGHALTLGKIPSTGEGRWWVDLLGPVTGAGRVNVVGRATLRGANAYSGGTTVDQHAWLIADSAANLGTGGVELRSSGTLTLEAAVESTMAGPLVSTTALANEFNNLQVNAPGATLRFQPGGLQGNGDLQISGLGTKILTGTNPFSGRLVTGTGGRLELIDTGGGASIAANGYSVYNTTFRVGPGATLVKAAGAPQLPYIAVDGAGRVEIEQSQNLSGLTVGLSTSGPTDNPTLIASPGVVLNLTFGLQGSYGTVDAALAGSVTSGSFLYKQANTVPGNTGTLTVSGQSTFTGRVFIESGVLSVNSLGMTGQPSALGAGGNIELFRYQNTSSTLRYTGPSATTDRLLQVDGIDAINAPSIIEVTNPAATLTWAGPVTYSTNTSVPRLQKGGVGTLAIASTGNTFYVPGTGGGNGKIGVLAGTLSVTGSVEAQVAVESGATASGKLVGANATNYRVVVGGGAVALTARAGGTVRAGTGGGTDVLGVDGVQFDAGSKFAVTVDGGASPTASRIQNSAAGNAINFSPVASTGKITLQLEKGAGAEFIPFQPVTVEVARTPGLIRRSNSAFAYNPDEWALVTVGFDIVPGSFSLLTTEGGSVLNARFTPVPEPAVPLAVGTAAAVLARRRLRWNRPTAAVTG